MPFGEAGRALGVEPNRLRYAAPTGRVLLRWDGARQPTIWIAPPPDVDPEQARLELARRYLHVFGPATPRAFATWAGIAARQGIAIFEALGSERTRVRMPIGEAWILARDEAALRAAPGPAAAARLLPSGDAYTLLQGADRELLVEDAAHRRELWPTRVWPGAVLVDGEIVGSWRRAAGRLSVSPWRRLEAAERCAVEDEAAGLPLPGIDGPVALRWSD